MSKKDRITRLERRHGGAAPSIDPGPLAKEVREINRNIKRLTAEIAEAEAGMSPSDLARSRAEFEEFDASLDGRALGERIEAITAEILEAEEGEG